MSDYYKAQLARLTDPEGRSLRIVGGKDEKTKWLGLNEESAQIIVDWLTEEYLKPEQNVCMPVFLWGRSVQISLKEAGSTLYTTFEDYYTGLSVYDYRKIVEEVGHSNADFMADICLTQAGFAPMTTVHLQVCNKTNHVLIRNVEPKEK